MGDNGFHIESQLQEKIMDWPTAAVLIATIIAIMAIVSTYLGTRSGGNKK